MFLSREFSRNLLPSIRRAAFASQRLNSRPLSNQSKISTSSKPLRSSGLVVFGSGLSILYCYSFFQGPNNSFSLAENSNETTRCETSDDDDKVWQSMPEEKKQLFLFGDSYRKRVFFKYEKRIRTQSPPEKVFEYFASVRTPGGEVFMTPADLMRAVIPVFPSSESNRVREGFLRGERVPGELHCPPSSFFMLFDTNNDGLISFGEYIFFVTLLSIPESSFSVAFKMFDLDNNGEIDKDEFMKVMALMRKQNRQGALYKDGQNSASFETGGILNYFFGTADSNGKACLKHEKFAQFLRDLHSELIKLEFAHYDNNSKGTISAEDFALSLVASAEIGHINKLLDRVDEIRSKPVLAGVRITFEEFKDFAELRTKLQPFSLAIFSYGKVNGVLTKNDFQRAASQVCGVSVTSNVIDVIFHVFGSNRDESLSVNEFVKVLQRREGETSHEGFSGLVSCWLNCATNCLSAKLRF